jgi:hypothetical protein
VTGHGLRRRSHHYSDEERKTIVGDTNRTRVITAQTETKLLVNVIIKTRRQKQKRLGVRTGFSK